MSGLTKFRLYPGFRIDWPTIGVTRLQFRDSAGVVFASVPYAPKVSLTLPDAIRWRGKIVLAMRDNIVLAMITADGRVAATWSPPAEFCPGDTLNLTIAPLRITATGPWG